MYHPLVICEHIAEKFSYPEKIEEAAFNVLYAEKYQTDQWHDWSLAEGMSGIAYFFSAMHEAFPGRNWKKMATHYLERSFQNLAKRKSADCSLYYGLAGLALATHYASDGSVRYQNCLCKLEDRLTEEIETVYLKNGAQYQSPTHYIPNFFYSLDKGLSGILHYLFIRKENEYLYKSAERCVDLLSKMLLTEKKLDQQTVAAWYVAREHILLTELKKQFPNGCFMLSFLVGISGCLCTLSTAALNGFDTPCLKEAIQKIASWLVNATKYCSELPYWDNTVAFDCSQSGIQDSEIQSSWACGWPGILRSLLLAGKATKDEALVHFACTNYRTLFTHTVATKQWKDPSFNLGLAGLIATTFSVWKATADDQLFRGIQQLETTLTTFYNPDLVFGFEPHFIDFGQDSVDIPGLLNGSLGVSLTLLLIQQRIDSRWMTPFSLGM